MFLQTVQVQGSSITQCWKLGLTVDYSSGPADDKFSLMCRRQATDDSTQNFLYDDTDDIFSDVFQFKLGRKGKSTPVKLIIPTFALPEPRDELILKSNCGHVIKVDKWYRDTENNNVCIYSIY